jgi:hypothetical protein
LIGDPQRTRQRGHQAHLLVGRCHKPRVAFDCPFRPEPLGLEGINSDADEFRSSDRAAILCQQSVRFPRKPIRRQSRDGIAPGFHLIGGKPFRSGRPRFSQRHNCERRTRRATTLFHRKKSRISESHLARRSARAKAVDF